MAAQIGGTRLRRWLCGRLWIAAFLGMMVAAAQPANAQSVPTPQFVTPSSGSASSGTFTATYFDPVSGSNITSATLYFSTGVPGISGWSAHQCLMRYDPGARNLYLVTDDGTRWSQPIVANGGGVLSNSQCTYYASGASSSVSGNTLTVTFSVVFNTSSFSGAKPIYLEAANGNGWSTNLQQQFGNWSIPFQNLPSVVSVSPESGSGASQQFTATYSDSNGGFDIQETVFYIMSNVVPGSGSGWSANECIVRFDPGSNNLYVVVDGGGGWSAPVSAGPQGSALGAASNSQCSVIGSGSGGVVSGNTLTVTLNVVFGSNFSGAKQLYLGVGNSAGFDTNYQQQFASWTVPFQSWNNVLNGTYQGSYFNYVNQQPTEQNSVPLMSSYSIPSSQSPGCTTNPPMSTCSASCTYPASAPFFVTSACRDSNGNTPPLNDCTGTHQQIYGPVSYSRTTSPVPSVKGLRFDGSFTGQVGSSATTITESVFVHEVPCYTGHAEYGFARNLPAQGGSPFFFYWSDNTNCDGTICSNQEPTPTNPTPPLFTSSVGLLDLSGISDPTQTARYQAQIVNFAGLKFLVSIYQSSGPLIKAIVVDPSDPRYGHPGDYSGVISRLNNAPLYVTVTIQSNGVPTPAFTQTPVLFASQVSVSQ